MMITAGLLRQDAEEKLLCSLAKAMKYSSVLWSSFMKRQEVAI
jgi:hypothetical protein